MERVTNRVRDIRMARGMTQADVCAGSGLDAGTVSRIDSNPFARPSLPVALKLAKALGVEPAELIEA
jgi:transcriptional regulator with XRE-family HTH domain